MNIPTTLSRVLDQANPYRRTKSQMRLRARPALMRSLRLYAGLRLLAEDIERQNAESPDPRLEIAAARITEQAGSLTSLLADWRDVVPEDADEQTRRLREIKNAIKESDSAEKLMSHILYGEQAV